MRRTLLSVAVAGVLATAAFIDLEVRIPLSFWSIDAPVADFAALLLCACLPLWWADRRPLLPVAPAVAFAAVAASSALATNPGLTHESAWQSLYWLLRKPIFCFVAYGVALPAALASVGRDRAERWLLAALGAVALVSALTSIGRFAAGDALWWAAVEGLTPNHKTLAVWLAPFAGWAWSVRERPVARAILALGAAALVLSLSKTAWLGACASLAFAFHFRDRPLVKRWTLSALAGALAVGALLALPWVSGDVHLQDAARSRRSLDLRAWEMFELRPLLGQGPGSSIGWELTEYPHYRVNGVESHGVVQKVASETGLAGLIAWGWFTAALGVAVARAQKPGQTRGSRWAWAGVLAAAHLELLASTEAFTMTHWSTLGLAWWGVFRSEDP